jgi:SAM-dependent methyltransferase
MSGCEHDTVRNTAFTWEIGLQCPCCRADIVGFDCAYCGFQMQTLQGVVHALPQERASYYARFISEYERIRAAEGRGSQDEAFYLGLPFKDITGRNNKQWSIRARSYQYLSRNILKRQGVRGTVLDLGAGNCWMSFRLALAGYKPVAVELLTNESDGLAAAAHYQKYLAMPLLRFQAEMTNLPFQSEQFDAIVFNASLHYSEDYEASLREALRCLRNGGLLIISDTPWYSREESGRQMVAERHSAFLRRYETASDSVRSLEFLTDERLRTLEERLSIQWTVHSPWYGLQWALRPWMAQLRRRREPSRFRIYTARKGE